MRFLIGVLIIVWIISWYSYAEAGQNLQGPKISIRRGMEWSEEAYQKNFSDCLAEDTGNIIKEEECALIARRKVFGALVQMVLKQRGKIINLEKVVREQTQTEI